MHGVHEDLTKLENSVDLEVNREIIGNIKEKLILLKSKKGLVKLINSKSIAKAVKHARYEKEMEALQVELIKLQNWVFNNNKRVMIIFEGRDAAGKGGAIKKFTQYLNPRKFRVAALQKPTEVETGQFFFQRYFIHLPNPGEIVFFDRSWYNRAIVEPVFNFCTQDQYEKFMKQIPGVEHALIDDGIIFIKFWFSITKDTQQARFKERLTNPLKHWKLSPVDEKAQDMWDEITHYKEAMFSKTHTVFAPWIIVDSNNKKKARLEAIKYVLSFIKYDGRDKVKVDLTPDQDTIKIYHKKTHKED